MKCSSKKVDVKAKKGKVNIPGVPPLSSAVFIAAWFLSWNRASPAGSFLCSFSCHWVPISSVVQNT
jgi:hypothetical protein